MNPEQSAVGLQPTQLLQPCAPSNLCLQFLKQCFAQGSVSMLLCPNNLMEAVGLLSLLVPHFPSIPNSASKGFNLYFFFLYAQLKKHFFPYLPPPHLPPFFHILFLLNGHFPSQPPSWNRKTLPMQSLTRTITTLTTHYITTITITTRDFKLTLFHQTI